MARLVFAFLIVCLIGGIGSTAGAQDPKPADPNDPVHDELRAVRDALVKAVNAKDIDGLVKHLHPNVVIVWQNAEISRGHKGVREYYQKNLGGPDAVLDSFGVKAEVAEYAIVHGGDTAVSFGSMDSDFKFRNGHTFTLKGPWSTTLVKEDGHWQIASFHASAGLFDNPLLAAATRALYWGCGIAAGIGLLIGVLGMALLRRGKKT